MKEKLKALLSLGIVAMTLISGAAIKREIVDVYTLQILLRVPQVINNMQSLGKRIYKVQKITGRILVHYDAETDLASSLELDQLVNKSFKVREQYVRYTYLKNDSMFGIPQIWNAVGNNKTLVFNKSSVCFTAELEPSYALSEANNDNSLILIFSGSGSMISKKIDGIKTRFPISISGYVTGTQGCGCHDYGHLSPTRVIGIYGASEQAIDIASVWGTWKAKFIYRTSTENK